eukprot:6191158-Pleurochrysis_carterae.AAC.3
MHCRSVAKCEYAWSHRRGVKELARFASFERANWDVRSRLLWRGRRRAACLHQLSAGTARSSPPRGQTATRRAAAARPARIAEGVGAAAVVSASQKGGGPRVDVMALQYLVGAYATAAVQRI